MFFIIKDTALKAYSLNPSDADLDPAGSVSMVGTGSDFKYKFGSGSGFWNFVGSGSGLNIEIL